MLSSVKIIDSGKQPPDVIMALDQKLLEDLEQSNELLIHFYEWSERSATYGLFIHPEDFLNMEGVVRQNLQLAKRPTGGGIVFHLSDFAFSVLVPATHAGFSINTLENYAFINRAVIRTIQSLVSHSGIPELLSSQPDPLDAACQHFCMAHPTKFDVMIGDRKVGGAAQRRTKFGFLHQGTISLGMPPQPFLDDVLKSTTVMQGMQQQAFSLLGPSYQELQLEQCRSQIKQILPSFIY